MGNMLNDLREIFLKADKSNEEGSLETEIKKAEGLSDEFKELLLKSLKETDYFAKRTFLNRNKTNSKGGTKKTDRVDNFSHPSNGQEDDNRLKGGEAR